MRKLLWVLVICFCLSGCQMFKKFTSVKSGDISLVHDSAINTAPEAHVLKTETRTPIPAGSTVKVIETQATDKTPAKTETIIELPKDKGSEISQVETKTDLVGSRGFEPAKGPTPLEKATAAWTYVGVGICLLGIFFCTPWGGSNFRVGGLIAAGGIGMSIIGKFIDQIKVPAPAMFFIFVAIALAVYYGYRVRHKQLTTPATPST